MDNDTQARTERLSPDGGVADRFAASAAEKRTMLEDMVRIRRLEEAWADAYLDGEVEGLPPSLSTGQEAVYVGTNAVLSDGDCQFTTHRGQGPQVAAGLDPDRILAELYMRADGYNGGKSYHVTDADRGVIGMGGIIGAQVPVAAGKALGQQLRGTDRVSVAYFGDGASNEGAVQEAAVLAAMWDLPLVFLCENNEYNISQPASHAVQGSSVAARAPGYGMPGEVVDGCDPLAVAETVAEAVERARAGHGPTFVEARTVRIAGHLAHDPQRYRPEGELADARARDPIDRFRRRLEAEGVIDEGEFEEIESGVETEIAEAVAFARESPFPDPQEAYEDCWADPPAGGAGDGGNTHEGKGGGERGGDGA
jgi:pyruvate dehydrogenase E1 component alpha subunit